MVAVVVRIAYIVVEQYCLIKEQGVYILQLMSFNLDMIQFGFVLAFIQLRCVERATRG